MFPPPLCPPSYVPDDERQCRPASGVHGAPQRVLASGLSAADVAKAVMQDWNADGSVCCLLFGWGVLAFRHPRFSAYGLGAFKPDRQERLRTVEGFSAALGRLRDPGCRLDRGTGQAPMSASLPPRVP